MKFLRDLISRIDQATKPRNPEREFGTSETIRQTELMRADPKAQRVTIDGKLY